MFAEYCKKTIGLPEKNVCLYEDATYGNIVVAIESVGTLDGSIIPQWTISANRMATIYEYIVYFFLLSKDMSSLPFILCILDFFHYLLF